MYGTTSNTVFELATGAQVLTTLHTFTNADHEGNYLGSGLAIDAAGNVYGTAAGSRLVTTVFELAAGTHVETTFTFSDAAITAGNAAFGNSKYLASDLAGNLYGTAGNDVFEFSTTVHTLTTLYGFTNQEPFPIQGAGLDAGLALDAAGNLYGTTTGAGGNPNGTISADSAGPSRNPSRLPFFGAQNPAITQVSPTCPFNYTVSIQAIEHVH